MQQKIVATRAVPAPIGPSTVMAIVIKLQPYDLGYQKSALFSSKFEAPRSSQSTKAINCSSQVRQYLSATGLFALCGIVLPLFFQSRPNLASKVKVHLLKQSKAKTDRMAFDRFWSALCSLSVLAVSNRVWESKFKFAPDRQIKVLKKSLRLPSFPLGYF